MSENNGWLDQPGVPPAEGWWWIRFNFSSEEGIRYFDGTFWRAGSYFAGPEVYAEHTLLGPAITTTEHKALQKRVAELEEVIAIRAQSGMAMVPREPTSKMHDAGFAVSVGGLLGKPMGYDFCTANRRIWIAMVEAAEKGERKKEDDPTEAELRKMMRDPRYWRKRDPEWVKRVTEGFRRLVGGKNGGGDE
jgi:hypothetical protein